MLFLHSMIHACMVPLHIINLVIPNVRLFRTISYRFRDKNFFWKMTKFWTHDLEVLSLNYETNLLSIGNIAEKFEEATPCSNKRYAPEKIVSSRPLPPVSKKYLNKIYLKKFKFQLLAACAGEIVEKLYKPITN